jgi:hypothetical protein
MVRPCSGPARQEKLARGAKPEEHAMSPQSPFSNSRDRHRYRKELISRGWSGQARRDHASAEVRLANLPPCLIGMEACVGAHHLSRKLKMLGHDARLMPAKYVRPYSKGQKNDFRDAEEGWVEHLQNAGFETKVLDTKDLDAMKQRLGVPEELAACHTAEVSGYVVEGHVPAAALKRFLAEKPNATGLGVPGMPIGSPGMQGGRPEIDDELECGGQLDREVRRLRAFQNLIHVRRSTPTMVGVARTIGHEHASLRILPERAQCRHARS